MASRRSTSPGPRLLNKEAHTASIIPERLIPVEGAVAAAKPALSQSLGPATEDGIAPVNIPWPAFVE